MHKAFFSLIISVILSSCSPSNQNPITDPTVVIGAAQIEEYLPLILDKNVGMTVNHTSLINGIHLVDTLLKLDINITSVYSPEHGFRGLADAGEKVQDETTDQFNIISLYGNNRKPTKDQLSGIDIMIFDIQDVGVRFYTYIGTMHYVMEACAENDIPVIVLDRPNPNGSYIDGPILDTTFTSFVGMHPVPVVHGMTVGEYAKMINGEGWLTDGMQCDLTVIPLEEWDHGSPYSLPVRPSPNLPNDLAVSLYPSLCLFEGTIVSVGRGTETPFQIYGHPNMSGDYTFTPTSSFGAKYPKLQGKECFGTSLVNTEPQYRFTLDYVLDAYHEISTGNEDFFTPYFDVLAGNETLRQQLESGLSELEIRETWISDLESFRSVRAKYLIYPE